ncbi:myosin-viia [Plakobranchus ocellatus]|uniref:Myosin-viia n=1 Tax=Plakobranchus ocellatus TaxID=259542 RepID=A0AAV3ZGW9_9GAST|nr:myosin-viia [Plakobranchus ocellatus]
MPGSRKFRSVPYLTLNSAVLKQKYREDHLFDQRLSYKRQDPLYEDQNGYPSATTQQQGGDCDGDYSDWYEGLADDLTRLLTKAKKDPLYEDQNGYPSATAQQQGGDCDGDYSDWYEGLADDLTRLLTKTKKDRSDSLSGVVSTQSAAAAFGDDIADDSYSVSELSQYHDDDKKGSKKQGRSAGKGKGAANFTKATLSRLPRDSVSAPADGEGDAHDSGIAGQSSVSDPSRQTSSGSNDPSDDVWAGEGGDGVDSGGGSGEKAPNEQKRSGSIGSESEDSELFATSSFASFAMTRFQAKMPYVYACSALPHPLLPQPDRADYLAALASWVTILRIMGDLPDVDTGHSIIVAGSDAPLTTRVKMGFKTRYTKKDVEDAHSKYTELFKDPTSVDTRTIPFMPSKADTMLDKVQLVCALGIFRASLRDELYCQLCKQLTSNPSRNSSVRGWVLMALFAGSFTPSEKFAPSLTSFLRDGPPEFSEKVDKILRRTCSSGTRGYPASWLEFQAAKNGKPLLVPVTFMNGHRLLCEVDAATTVCEVIQNISDRIELQDVSGCSLYVALQNKISCLGNGQHRVMDAISECEQHTKQMGHKESHSLWRIFFRREFFTPWHRPGLDPVCTDLDYQQIRRGVAMGEYKSDSETSLIHTVAKMFYIDNPEDDEFSELTPYVTTLLPEDYYDRSRCAELAVKVQEECDKLNLFSQRPEVQTVKANVVAQAQEKYYTLFTRYYDASKAVIPEGTVQEKVQEECDKLNLFSQRPEVQTVKANVVAQAQEKYYTLFTRYYDASKAVTPEGTVQVNFKP